MSGRVTMSGVDRGGATQFRGIRFATARRMEAPVDVESYEPGYVATEFGAQAPQIGGAFERLLGADVQPMDEDCLFLNVSTPCCDDAARPVLVWIHGGAFLTGSGSMSWYDGAPLTKAGDVVVVTLNYRLGALGFLGGRNLGTLDQISALRWVQRNIADFGGDPSRVTIFGESAGGSAVVSLMAAPGADNLFSAAWAMSPSLLQLRSATKAERLESDYLDQLPTSDAILTTDLADLLSAQSKMSSNTVGLQNFSPTAGTDVIPESILDRSSADSRPLVIGTNRDEMLLFTAFDPSRSAWTAEDVEHQFAARFGEGAVYALKTYRRHRPNTSASQLVSAMQTDEFFRRPAQRLAESRARAGTPTWMYSFEQESTAFGGMLGACHGVDIPYVFDTLDAQGAEIFTGSDPERFRVAADLSAALLSFARSHSPEWDAFELDHRPTRRFGPVSEITLDPEPELRALWRDLSHREVTRRGGSRSDDS
jgi:para-nitrobenzyl esterase